MLRHLLILLSGTAGAQAFTLFITPFLSRSYLPEDFGRLGVVLATSSILAIALHGRLTLAIAGAGGLNAAWRIVACATRLNVLLTSACLFIAGALVLTNFLPNYSAPVLLLIPVFASFSAQVEIYNYWQSYRKQFKLSAKNAVFRSISTGLIQLVLAGAASFGMVIGALVGSVISVFSSARRAGKERLIFSLPTINLREAVATLKENKRYPLYSMPQGLVASSSLNSVPILLSMYFGAAVAGQYWLAFRILLAPISLIGGAYRQIVHAQLSDATVYSLAQRFKLARRHTWILLAISSPIMLILILGGQFVFVSAFGPQWAIAGSFSGYLTICFSLDLIKIPAVTLLQSLSFQRALLSYELILAGLRVGAVACFSSLGEAINAIQAFSVVSAAGAIFITSFIFLEKKVLERSVGAHSDLDS